MATLYHIVAQSTISVIPRTAARLDTRDSSLKVIPAMSPTIQNGLSSALVKKRLVFRPVGVLIRLTNRIVLPDNPSRREPSMPVPITLHIESRGGGGAGPACDWLWILIGAADDTTGGAGAVVDGVALRGGFGGAETKPIGGNGTCFETKGNGSNPQSTFRSHQGHTARWFA